MCLQKHIVNFTLIKTSTGPQTHICYLWWKHIKLLHYDTCAQGRGTTLTLQTYNVSFFTHRNHDSEQIECSKLVGGSWSTTLKCTGPLGRICIDPIRTNQDCTPRGRLFSSVEPLLNIVLSPYSSTHWWPQRTRFKENPKLSALSLALPSLPAGSTLHPFNYSAHKRQEEEWQETSTDLQPSVLRRHPSQLVLRRKANWDHRRTQSKSNGDQSTAAIPARWFYLCQIPNSAAHKRQENNLNQSFATVQARQFHVTPLHS